MSFDHAFFSSTKKVTLVLKGKLSWSGDDYSIKDAHTDTPCFQVEGKMKSIKAKKTFLDAYGEPAFNMKLQLTSLVRKHIVYKGTDSTSQLFKIETKFALKPNLYIHFNNLVDGVPCELGCKGDWRARQCVLWLDRGMKGKENRVVVGHISSSALNAAKQLFDKQTYFLRIAPGVDMALMVAICVALDVEVNEAV
ncbi:tubby C-terminal-like domain-containing protein [Powellomyces hirtus]|nr:tubby C-terminal-like domain-containing protein [Powellomyces hirtus]